MILVTSILCGTWLWRYNEYDLEIQIYNLYYTSLKPGWYSLCGCGKTFIFGTPMNILTSLKITHVNGILRYCKFKSISYFHPFKVLFDTLDTESIINCPNEADKYSEVHLWNTSNWLKLGDFTYYACSMWGLLMQNGFCLIVLEAIFPRVLLNSMGCQIKENIRI